MSQSASSQAISQRKKGVRRKPKLTEDNLEEFLKATLRIPARQSKLPHPGAWLIFRLIIEHGLRTGEIVGTRHKYRPGIQYDDLKEDSIWIHSKLPGEKRFYFHGERLGKKDYFPVPVSINLLREIRRLADTHGLRGKLFDIHEAYVRKLTRKFAKEAKIPQYAS